MRKQVVCAHCHRTNRVPEDRLGDHPRCGACKQPLFGTHPVELNDATFSKHIGNNDLPVVVDFWAAWCGPCQMMAPEFARAGERLQTKAIFAKVNTEQAPGVSSQFGIRSIPTVILFKGGREVDRVSGAMNAAQLEQWVRRHL